MMGEALSLQMETGHRFVVIPGAIYCHRCDCTFTLAFYDEMKRQRRPKCFAIAKEVCDDAIPSSRNA